MRLLKVIMTATAIFQLLICSSVHAVPMQKSDDKSAVSSEDLLPDDLFQDSGSPSEMYDPTIETPVSRIKYFLSKGMYSVALETIASLSEEERNRPDIIGLKAAALIGKNDFASALNEYNSLKNRNDATARSFLIIADMLLKKNQPFAAMMACQSGLMRDVQSARLLYQMGYAYDQMGKADTALSYYKGAVRNSTLERQRSAIEKAIAVAYYKLNDYENARNVLIGKTLEGADSGLKSIIDAKYYVSQGNYDQAISLLDKAKESPRYLAAELTRAQVFIVNSESEQALKLLNELAINFNYSNFSDTLKLTRALAFQTGGNAAKSLDLLKSFEHPELIPNIHMIKAITYYSLNDNKSAIEELKQTVLPYTELAAMPDFENYLNQPSLGPDLGLAYFCLDQRYYTQAINIARKAAEKSKDNVFFRFILAESYQQTGKFTPAIKELIKINDVFKGSYAAKFFLSQAYARAGMLSEAAKTYKSLTEERPDFIQANLIYGKLLSDHSKWEEARKVYEHGLNFMPESPHLLISLGWTLAQLNETASLENLMQIIEKNEKIEPVSLLHLKGWAAFEKGEFSKAEEWLTSALDKAPGDPEICYHLGMAMMKSGHKEMAKNLLKQSLLFDIQKERYQKGINQILQENQ